MNGHVTACAVTASSGNAVLDQATCVLATRRFLYRPAVRAGRPQATQVMRAFTWHLPND